MILLTGFEPFGGLVRNPSADVAMALAGRNVEAAVLPVDYERVGPALDELLARHWDAIVLMGVAIGRGAISLERVAINHRDGTRPDNTGRAPPEPAVVPGGPDAYFSTLPLESLRDHIAATGVPVEISLTAGAYLCNTSFYLARHKTGDIPCGFVHLPPTPDLACGATPLPLADQMRGVGALLEALRQ